MSAQPQPPERDPADPRVDRRRRVGASRARTPGTGGAAGIVLSLLGLLAALLERNPRALPFAVPLLIVGVSLSITSARIAGREAAPRRLALGGAVVGGVGLIVTALLLFSALR